MKKVPIVLLILGGVLADFIGMVGCICFVPGFRQR